MTAEAGFSAQLVLSLDSVAAAMRQRNRLDQEAASSIWWVEAPALTLTVLPVINSAIGPNTGFAWAVQRITVGPFGATADLINVYKGHSAADLAPQNALISFTNQAVGSFGTWHPGTSGLVLMPDESLLVAGTITGTQPMLSWDVIQIESSFLPHFLK